MTIIYSSKPLREREPSDFYPTPKELIRAVLKDYAYNHSEPKSILDPGCGDGVWGEVAKEFWPNAKITGIDIRKIPRNNSYDNWITDDFLNSKNYMVAQNFDLVIGNPPFKYAEQFLDLCMGTNVIFLLRASFLESKKRYEKYYRHKDKCPTEVKISTRRISFTGNKKSDNTMYGIYYWLKSNFISQTRLGWLDWDYDKE